MYENRHAMKIRRGESEMERDTYTVGDKPIRNEQCMGGRAEFEFR